MKKNNQRCKHCGHIAVKHFTYGAQKGCKVKNCKCKGFELSIHTHASEGKVGVI